ncbi:hypothetical protein [Endozoicomonas arenosclerae]|uniref:hypothetical protein n=1 Tax=Endozoicomonas arenosclerae TaxID=1633495 RepID=UPI000784094F|nr:hypothetical protein [Endozoicomonas arenosclerae]
MMKLYHRVPKTLKFDRLLPLNKLEHRDDELYEENNWKYLHRLEVKKKRVPHLNCLWNDVIHMTPVHPSAVNAALKQAGFTPGNNSKWFEICPKTLGFSKQNSVIYLYPESAANSLESLPEDYLPFDLNQLKGLEVLRDEVEDYYRVSREKGERPLTFHLVPHVLYHGELLFEDMNIIEV